MSKKRITAAQTLRWALLTAAVVAVVGYGMTWLDQQQTMKEKAADIASLEAELEQLRLSSAALESDLRFSQTDAYIERLAREELGYVKNGEIKFVLQEDAEEKPNE